jgi:hypothetical protein
MSPFKLRHTFESVVCELVAGLEDGTIVLSKEAAAPQPEKLTGTLREQVSPHSAPASPRPGEPSPR